MYRFGLVARAIGLGEPALRNWLRRNEIDLFEPKPESGWLTFTLNDVFVLAIAAQLVRFGAPVKAAVDGVRCGLGSVNFETLEGLPDYLFAAPFGERWEVSGNENLVSSMCGPVLIKLAPAIIMNEARKRLAATKIDGLRAEIISPSIENSRGDIVTSRSKVSA